MNRFHLMRSSSLLTPKSKVGCKLGRSWAFTLELTPYEMYEVQQCKLVFRSRSKKGRVFGRCPNHNSSIGIRAFHYYIQEADFPRQEFHEVWLIERTIMGGALAQMPDWGESTNEQPQFYWLSMASLGEQRKERRRLCTEWPWFQESDHITWQATCMSNEYNSVNHWRK